MNCMKVLCAAGIKEIFYIEDYKNDIDIVEYFSQVANVNIVKLK